MCCQFDLIYLRAVNNKNTQPAKKNKPPIGVIAPNLVKLVTDSTYNEPENIIIPLKKLAVYNEMLFLRQSTKVDIRMQDGRITKALCRVIKEITTITTNEEYQKINSNREKMFILL